MLEIIPWLLFGGLLSGFVAFLLAMLFAVLSLMSGSELLSNMVMAGLKTAVVALVVVMVVDFLARIAY